MMFPEREKETKKGKRKRERMCIQTVSRPKMVSCLVQPQAPNLPVSTLPPPKTLKPSSPNFSSYNPPSVSVTDYPTVSSPSLPIQIYISQTFPLTLSILGLPMGLAQFMQLLAANFPLVHPPPNPHMSIT